MRVHCRDIKSPSVIIDSGTGRRIPFAVWFDQDTGEYEAREECDNGKAVSTTYLGKAVGRLVLVPYGNAKELVPKESQPSLIRTTSDNQKLVGLDQYRKVYRQVWQFRGEASKHVDQRWVEYLRNTPFFDHLILKRRLFSRG